MRNVLRLLLCLMLAAGASQVSAAGGENNMVQSHNHGREHNGKREVSRHKVISDKDFELLCSLVCEGGFDKDKITILRAGTIGNYFTCKQAAELLSLLSFDSNKLDALRFIAPHIVGRKDMDELIAVFSFSSNKDEALRIFSKRDK